MVVFASSTGTESSGVYRDKQHGFFTYFLLRKIQESKGNVSYGELGEYIRKEVSRETVLSTEKIQTPSIQASEQVRNVWEEWKILGN